MQLELTEDERAFRDEMREFFTTKVSEETRETVAAGRELTKDQLVESMRTLNAAGLAVPRWPSVSAAMFLVSEFFRNFPPPGEKSR